MRFRKNSSKLIIIEKNVTNPLSHLSIIKQDRVSKRNPKSKTCM